MSQEKLAYQMWLRTRKISEGAREETDGNLVSLTAVR